MDQREITIEDLRDLFPPRPRESHKGTFGRVLLVCGSMGMAGAAVLCAKAALRSGAGLVTLAVPEELFSIIQTAVPEAMCIDRRSLDPSAKYDAIAVGCGMGATETTYATVRELLEYDQVPLIIDADGINAICLFEEDPCGLRSIIHRRKAPVILTPHPKEAKRLLDLIGEEKTDISREETAGCIAEKTGATVILKGHETLIRGGSSEGGGVFINRTGNPGMAAGGSGDVLTGVTAALFAFAWASGYHQDRLKQPLLLGSAAVHIHGWAGDLAAEDVGEVGMTAMDIVSYLPHVFRIITRR